MATLSADGATSAVKWRGGDGNVEVSGTFGGGTATVQKSTDGGTTWKDMDTTNLSFTETTFKTFRANDGDKLRVNLSGSTTPTLEVFINESSKA